MMSYNCKVSINFYQSQVSSLYSYLLWLIADALLSMVETAEEIKAFITFVIKGIEENNVNQEHKECNNSMQRRLSDAEIGLSPK